MSLQSIHLRKILKIMYLHGPDRISELRKDIRADIRRANGDDEGGGDFYGPFWSDAKDHVFNIRDLSEQTEIRISVNDRRKVLYTQLRDGFLLWWDRRRRWTNQPFIPADKIKRTCRLPGIDADIKFENILSVRDGRDEEHFVYPYWFPEPELSEEAARLALWALACAFPQVSPGEIRVLDVIRGRTFASSSDRNPLIGNEASLFKERFDRAVEDWMKLRSEYGDG